MICFTALELLGDGMQFFLIINFCSCILFLFVMGREPAIQINWLIESVYAWSAGSRDKAWGQAMGRRKGRRNFPAQNTGRIVGVKTLSDWQASPRWLHSVLRKFLLAFAVIYFIVYRTFRWFNRRHMFDWRRQQQTYIVVVPSTVVRRRHGHVRAYNRVQYVRDACTSQSNKQQARRSPPPSLSLSFSSWHCVFQQQRQMLTSWLCGLMGCLALTGRRDCIVM